MPSLDLQVTINENIAKYRFKQILQDAIKKSSKMTCGTTDGSK